MFNHYNCIDSYLMILLACKNGLSLTIEIDYYSDD